MEISIDDCRKILVDKGFLTEEGFDQKLTDNRHKKRKFPDKQVKIIYDHKVKRYKRDFGQTVKLDDRGKGRDSNIVFFFNRFGSGYSFKLF